jgi:predicted Zn-dependent protease
LTWGLARTIDRARDWRDNCTLANATLVTAPASPIFLTMRARCLLDAGDASGARAHLERAFAAERDFPTAHVVWGMLEERAENTPAALVHYDALLAREPQHLVALSRSAVLLHRTGRFAEAAVRYAAWRDATPNDPRPWEGLIAAQAQSGDLTGARETARQAKARFPQSDGIRRNAEAVERLPSTEPAR